MPRTIIDRLTSKLDKNHKFTGLDALRGAAALTVAFGHAALLFGFRPASSYLAVDLFFVLSGFVLAHAYDHKISAGMGTFDFMRVRLIRLYPIYCLGIAITTFGILIAQFGHKGSNWTLSSLGRSLPFSLVFLPTPLHWAPRESIYPLDTPAWSLAFELIVNLGFVAVWRWLSIRCLIVIVVLSGAALILTAFHYGDLSCGSDWMTVFGGFPRVFFSFPLGVLLLRLYREHGLRWNITPLVPLVLMLAILIYEPAARFRPVYDLCCVMLAFPFIVAAGATTRPLRFAPLYELLGALSYALYALHFPIMEIITSALTKMFQGDVTRGQPWAGFAFIGIALATAYVADARVDAPMRRWLTKKLPTHAKRSSEPR